MLSTALAITLWPQQKLPDTSLLRHTVEVMEAASPGVSCLSFSFPTTLSVFLALEEHWRKVLCPKGATTPWTGRLGRRRRRKAEWGEERRGQEETRFQLLEDNAKSKPAG